MLIYRYRREILIALLATSFLILNVYLNIEKLSVYSHASDDHALLNVRWGMSPKEVEKATSTGINQIYGDYGDYGTYHQKLRLTDRSSKSNIRYYFYDNRLYKIKISKNIKFYKDSILNQLITSTYFNYKRNNILEKLKVNNKYLYEENYSMIFIYTDGDTLDKSSQLHLTLGDKPIVNSIRSQQS